MGLFNLFGGKITVDENGRPINVEVAERRIANKIIEEFMIISNEVVSEQFYWMHLPFLYRIHEEPSEEKIEALNAVIRHLGLKLSTQNLSSRDVQKLIEEVKGKDIEFGLWTLVKKKKRLSIRATRKSCFRRNKILSSQRLLKSSILLSVNYVLLVFEYYTMAWDIL